MDRGELAGYSSQGCRESDMTEQLSTHTQYMCVCVCVCVYIFPPFV